MRGKGTTLSCELPLYLTYLCVYLPHLTLSSFRTGVVCHWISRGLHRAEHNKCTICLYYEFVNEFM